MPSSGATSSASKHPQHTVSWFASRQQEGGQTICGISIISEVTKSKTLDNTIGPEQDIKVIEDFESSSRGLVRRLHARPRETSELQRTIADQAVAHAEAMKALIKSACKCQRIVNDDRNKRSSRLENMQKSMEKLEAELVMVQKTRGVWIGIAERKAMSLQSVRAELARVKDAAS